MTRDKHVYQEFRALQSEGWRLTDKRSYVEYTDTETKKHKLSKTVACDVLLDNGYRVGGEVENDPLECRADILAWGHKTRDPVVVELENDCQQEIREKKLEQYRTESIREVFVINLDDCMVGGNLEDTIRETVGLL